MKKSQIIILIALLSIAFLMILFPPIMIGRYSDGYAFLLELKRPQHVDTTRLFLQFLGLAFAGGAAFFIEYLITKK